MSDKSQHTPGPWEMAEAGGWKDGKRTSTEYFVRRPGDDVAIASDIIDPANNDAPSEANAHLIAAAPDLLEALEKCVDVIGSPQEEGGHWASTEEVNSAYNSARAAIAKAKGGAK